MRSCPLTTTGTVVSIAGFRYRKPDDLLQACIVLGKDQVLFKACPHRREDSGRVEVVRQRDLGALALGQFAGQLVGWGAIAGDQHVRARLFDVMGSVCEIQLGNDVSAVSEDLVNRDDRLIVQPHEHHRG